MRSGTVPDLYRDAFLAFMTLILIIAISIPTVGAGALIDPIGALAGVAGMVGLELLLLRNPEWTARVWGRALVRAAAVLITLGAAGAAVVLGAGGFVLAVLAWGLTAYLWLVALVASMGMNPLAELYT